MDSTPKGFLETHNDEIICVLVGSVLSILFWGADLVLPWWTKWFLVHSYHIYQFTRIRKELGLLESSRLKQVGALLCSCFLTHELVIHMQSSLLLRIEWLIIGCGLNAAFQFWFYLNVDDAHDNSLEQVAQWRKVRNITILYMICSLAIGHWSLVWSTLRTTGLYICLAVSVYLAVLWNISAWTRYSMFEIGIRPPGRRILSIYLLCKTGYELLMWALAEGIPNFIQRVYINAILKRKRFRELSHYEYKPLGAQDYRLLLLKRSSWFRPSMIETELVHMTPGKQYPGIFSNPEVISYRWGSPDRSKTILVDGLLFNLTHSAFEIMLARRSLFRDRVLWIDFICINQDDNAEKSREVARLRYIYRMASRVIVFLGSGWQIRLAAQVVDDIHSALRFSPRELEDWIGLKHSIRRSALNSLLMNDYFTRVWIIQEIVVSLNVELYLAGNYKAWKEFAFVEKEMFSTHRNLLLQTHNKDERRWPQNYTQFNLHILAMFNSMALKAGQNHIFSTKLETLIFFTKQFLCADGRDKLFAIQGLATGNDDLQIDYSKSCEEVYEDMAKYLFFLQASINLLALAGTGRLKPRRTLPSWVPDLSQELKGNTFTHIFLPFDVYQASGESRLVAAPGPYPKTLSLRGLLCDRIVGVNTGSSLDFGEKPGELFSLIFTSRCKLRFVETACELVLLWGHSGQQLILERLWNVLIANRVDRKTRRPDPGWRDLFKVWLRREINSAQAGNDEGIERMARTLDVTVYSDDFQLGRIPEVSQYDDDMVAACIEKCFATSAEERMCLVPPKTKEGDVVFVPYGSQVPYIIRPIEPSDSGTVYELLGEAYVDGIMEGEAMNIGLQEAEICLK